jgi:hypothetical protein
MSRAMQDILVIDYNGPQGSKELETVESASVNRNKSRSRVKTMNRQRRSIGFQSGTEEVTISLSVIPEKLDPEIDWVKAWREDEEFSLAIEKGLGGRREQLIGCLVVSVNSSHNENGEARDEVEVEGLRTRDED